MAHKKGEGSRTANNLTGTQIARLYAWMEGSRTWAAENTAQKCAELAVQELKFGITSSNILSAKKNLNITKPAPAAPIPEYATRDETKVLAECLVSVCGLLKIVSPVALVALAGFPVVKAAPEQPTLFKVREGVA